MNSKDSTIPINLGFDLDAKGPAYSPVENIMRISHKNHFLPGVQAKISPGILEINSSLKMRKYVYGVLDSISEGEVFYTFKRDEEWGNLELVLSEGAANALLEDPDIREYFDDTSNRLFEGLLVVAGREDDLTFPAFMDADDQAEAISEIRFEVLRRWPALGSGDDKIDGDDIRVFADQVARRINSLDENGESMRTAVHESEHYKTYHRSDMEAIKELILFYDCAQQLELEDEADLATIIGSNELFGAFNEAISITHELFGSGEIVNMDNYGGEFLIPRIADVLRFYSIDPGDDAQEPEIIDLLTTMYEGKPFPRNFAHRLGVLMVLLPEEFIDFSQTNFINWDILLTHEGAASVQEMNSAEKAKLAARSIYDILVEAAENPDSVGERVLEESRIDLFREGFEKSKLQFAKDSLKFYNSYKKFFPSDFRIDHVAALIEQ